MSNSSLVVVYFIYGLSFFTLGLALLFKKLPQSLDFLTPTIRYSGYFGLCHGASEWLLMAHYNSGDANFPYLALARLVGSASFFLFLPACTALARIRYPGRDWLYNSIFYILLAICLSPLLLLSSPGEAAALVSGLTRWLVGAPTAIAIGLLLYSSVAHPPEHADFARLFREHMKELPLLRVAVISICVTASCYGLSHFFGPTLPYLPFSVVNADLFRDVFGFEVAIMRACVGFLTSAGVIFGFWRLNELEWMEMEGKIEDRTRALTLANADLKRAVSEAEQAALSKSVFLASISHELRTPLNAIVGYSQFLTMTIKNLTAEQKEQLGHIEDSGNHLSRIVGDLLDVTTIEQAMLDFESGPVEVSGLTRSVVGELQPIARKNGISLTHAEKGMRSSMVFAKGETRRLKQVMINLVNNAIKYNRPKGSVTVGVKHLENDMVQIFVDDTGYGIPAAKTDKIFKLFERVDDQPYVKKEGLGIGLAISKQLTEGMGGTIGFHNRLEGGCRFWVTLPAAVEDTDQNTPAPTAGTDTA